MAAKRRWLVLFDLGGVLLGRGAMGLLRSAEQSRGLPGNFFQDVILHRGLDGPFSRAMTGKIGLTQLIAEFDEDCKKFAAASGFPLPEKFSVAQLFEELAGESFNATVLQAALTLRNHGFKIAVLTNNWIDDGPHRHRTGQAFLLLRRYFDMVFESCRIGLQKPDPRIYEYVLEVMKAKPEESILLDDIGANLKPAQAMGIATILVQDADSALKELQDLTGVQLLDQEEPLPPACEPENVTHGYVTVKRNLTNFPVPMRLCQQGAHYILQCGGSHGNLFKPGTRLHYVEMGSGPVVCLCHGFPESWLSWRYQIPALADAGFRVLALEMKGYGDSTAPADIEEYSQEEICKDLSVFLDKMGISQAVFIGHDWGGATVWHMAVFYPERVRAVASLNTPYKPSEPGVDVMEKIKSIPVFNYQLYFQEPGVAEAELEKNLSRTLKIMIRSTRNEDKWMEKPSVFVADAQKRGGLLLGLPEDPPASSLLPEPVLQYYIQQFQKSGFRGPLNWYRNMQATWDWSASAQGRKIQVPALMVTAGKDFVLHPQMSKHMEKWIPQLTRGHIEECGHFTQMERPAAVNKILIDWLEGVHDETSASLQRSAKL